MLIPFIGLVVPAGDIWSSSHGRVFNLHRLYWHGRALPLARVSLRYLKVSKS